MLRRLFPIFLAVFQFGFFSQMPAGTDRPQSTKTSAQRPENAGAPVLAGGQTLFTVHERLFTFSAEDRANAVSQRVNWLSKQPLKRIQSISIAEEGNNTEIVSEDLIIMTVTDADAVAAGRSRQELAKDYAGKIQAAALALQREFSFKTVLFATTYTVLATVLLLLVLKLLAVVFPKFYRKVESWHGVYIRSLRIQKLELLPAERITGLLTSLAKLLRAIISLLLFYVYVTLVLGFFPWTRGYSGALSQYILSPVRAVAGAILAFLPNVFFILVILAAAYYVVKFVKFVFSEIAKGTVTLPGFYAEWAQPTYKIARFLIVAFTAVVLFPYLPGSKSPAFQGVSIFLGLLLSLGSSSAVANVVAGTVLTYTRAFTIGDRIKIGDALGDVTEKTLLVTRIRTIKNVDIAIPNALVLSSHIINFSSAAQDHGLILHTGVTIGYDAPWRQVHQLLLGAAEATANVLKDPKPFVLQTSLDDFYVSYQLNAYTDQPTVMASTYSDLHQNIQDKFNEAGVEIMSPHYGAIRDGNQIAIPEGYVPHEYVVPEFRISSTPPKTKSTYKEGAG